MVVDGGMSFFLLSPISFSILAAGFSFLVASGRKVMWGRGKRSTRTHRMTREVVVFGQKSKTKRRLTSQHGQEGNWEEFQRGLEKGFKIDGQ